MSKPRRYGLMKYVAIHSLYCLVWSRHLLIYPSKIFRLSAGTWPVGRKSLNIYFQSNFMNRKYVRILQLRNYLFFIWCLNILLFFPSSLEHFISPRSYLTVVGSADSDFWCYRLVIPEPWLKSLLIQALQEPRNNLAEGCWIILFCIDDGRIQTYKW